MSRCDSNIGKESRKKRLEIAASIMYGHTRRRARVLGQAIVYCQPGPPPTS